MDANGLALAPKSSAVECFSFWVNDLLSANTIYFSLQKKMMMMTIKNCFYEINGYQNCTALFSSSQTSKTTQARFELTQSLSSDFRKCSLMAVNNQFSEYTIGTFAVFVLMVYKIVGLHLIFIRVCFVYMTFFTAFWRNLE